MMRADELVVLTKAEFDELNRGADPAAGESFNVEEMQAIREQYEERAALAEQRCEELEWRVRLELAKIRDAELSARRAADEMRRVELTLQGLLTADEEVTEVRSVVPSATLQPVAPKPQALRKPVPPPIPEAGPPRNGNGASHADAFRAAMSHRKHLA
jgi:hypothetical protein